MLSMSRSDYTPAAQKLSGELVYFVINRPLWGGGEWWPHGKTSGIHSGATAISGLSIDVSAALKACPAPARRVFGCTVR